MPENPVAVLLDASRAVTVKLKATPAVAAGGAVTAKWVATPPVLVNPKLFVIDPAVTATL